MDNNHTRATTPVHAVHDSPYLEQVLRLTCIGILWVATFWCIPYVLGQLSTALVVTGRVVAVAIAGVLMFRVRGTQWSLATSIGHTSVVGLIYAILPMVLFFCIGAIVPRSQPVAATMLATLGFVLARILLIGHPQRLRVLVGSGLVYRTLPRRTPGAGHAHHGEHLCNCLAPAYCVVVRHHATQRRHRYVVGAPDMVRRDCNLVALSERPHPPLRTVSRSDVSGPGVASEYSAT